MPTRRRDPIGTVPDLGRHARPVRGLGLDLPRDRHRGRDVPAVHHGRRSGSGWPGVILLTWSIAPRPVARSSGRPGASGATRPSSAALLLGGGMGLVAWGEQTIPSGHRGAHHRDDARLDRRPRRHLPRRAPAAAGRRRDPHRVRRRRDPRRSVGLRRHRRDGSGRRRGDPALADRLGLRLALRLPSGDPAEPAARRDRRPDGHRRRRPRRHGRCSAGSGRRSTRRPSRATRSSRSSTSRSSAASLAYTTYSWLLGVAPLPLVSTYAYVNPIVAVILGWLILQEPIDARTLVAGAVIVVAVVLIVHVARADCQRPSRALPRHRRRSRLRQDRPRHLSCERHDRDHRVDADARREQGAVRDVEARGRRRRRARRRAPDRPGRMGASPDPRPSGPSPSGGPRRPRRDSG